MTYTFAHLGMSKTPIRLTDLFRYYKGAPHQNAALQELEAQILKASPDVFNRDQNWYNTWSSTVPDKADGSPNSWDGVIDAAKRAGAKYPECVAAQWALESGWGKHTSAKNNFFGLKGDGASVLTKEFIDGQWIEITDSFINFPTLNACIEYLVGRWYKDFKGYKGVNCATSADECAKLLVKEGYATDPDYAEKLIRLMKDQGLQSSDQRILDVPYEYQLDNKSGTGYRECFSSTCAMIAKYYGKVSSDDQYNAIRAKFGDTTSSDAQVLALRDLGLDARFILNGTAAVLENEIKNNRPVAVGWLHYGSASAPHGGGHWSCCIGYTKDAFVFNDPNGEADVANGGYIDNSATAGKRIKYSRNNWLKRWEVDGNATGWAILVKP